MCFGGACFGHVLRGWTLDRARDDTPGIFIGMENCSYCLEWDYALYYTKLVMESGNKLLRATDNPMYAILIDKSAYYTSGTYIYEETGDKVVQVRYVGLGTSSEHTLIERISNLGLPLLYDHCYTRSFLSVLQ